MLIWCFLGNALLCARDVDVGWGTLAREVTGGHGKLSLCVSCGVFGEKEMLIAMKGKKLMW